MSEQVARLLQKRRPQTAVAPFFDFGMSSDCTKKGRRGSRCSWLFNGHTNLGPDTICSVDTVDGLRSHVWIMPELW